MNADPLSPLGIEEWTLEFIIRPAEKDDLPQLIELLANDKLSATQEDTLPPINPRYEVCLEYIQEDTNNDLMVAVSTKIADKIVGMLQMSFIPSLSDIGSWRGLIDEVKVDRYFTRSKIKNVLLDWAIERARERNCHIIQFAPNKRPIKATPFYDSIGFVANHEGMTLTLK